MTEPSLIARQRHLLRELRRRAAARAAAEPVLEESYRTRREAAEQELREASRQVTERFAADKEAADQEMRQAREAIQARYDAEQAAIEEEFATARQAITDRYEAEKEAAQDAFRESRWTIGAELEGARDTAETQLNEQVARLAAKRQRLEAVRQKARKLLAEWKQPLSYLDPPPPATGAASPGVATPGLPAVKLVRSVARAEEDLAALEDLVVPRFLKGKRLPVLSFLAWLVLVYPLGWLVAHFTRLAEGLTGVLMLGLAASTLVTLVGALITRAVLASVARSQVREIAEPLGESLAEADGRCRYILESFNARCRRQSLAAKKRHDHKLRRVRKQYKQQARAIKRRRAEVFPPVLQRYETGKRAGARRYADDLRAAEERHDRLGNELWQRYETDRRQVEERGRAVLAEIEADHERGWAELIEGWRRTVEEARAEIEALNREAGRLFPAWDDPAWQDWKPGAAPPPVLRFGDYRVSKGDIPDAVPAGERLGGTAVDDFTLPALAAFPDSYSMLFRAHDAGRDRAVEAVQAALFRLLTMLPPGKVRFTIIDPVGLGQNFATFMHLADYDDLLVTSRIWTESAHIEQRLADLTAHMENVIQKYLRNRYPTIADYNAEAGEVAEPFRVLVVANFPVHFTEEAARRLVSIAQNGPRCGVSPLVMVDTRQPLPKGFDLADLEKAGVNFVWQDGRFRWNDPDFGPFPLRPEAPPAGPEADRILQRAGERAREARRVEVPFEFIAPPPAGWWAADSRQGIDVALGRAGATKRQYLRLGRGTAQHVLVAGKTGSGKSTLLHALIVNLALTYGPDEVELYLVDFKKGVEFKTYAVHELPHARVVAIESEREFGLSVLQRLDAELKRRGEWFRAVGAQDVAGYRQARPGARLPRILLVVDEFQEFFTEDDRIAQDAAQLLDRLVRQGRAFGLHVLLGSQTLGGAYSLARSTIDQMAVRVALQCSEADAQLILSADNAAARLLSRPGEAIYNDANGLVEGNSPFQVVWLGESRREDYLSRLHDKAWRAGGVNPPVAVPSLVVFEGNAPADVSRNRPLRQLLYGAAPAAADGRSSRQVYQAWLGEAMAIEDQTAARFRRQNGSNLLLVGQQEETAVGMLTTALIGLAAQLPVPEPTPAGPATFYVLDGSQPGAPDAGLLARLPDLLPQPVRLAGWRQAPALLAELGAEVDRRQKAADAEAAPIFLVLFGLQRFRDLRRQEDDYSFLRKGDEAASPSQQLATLLREGATLGVHTLIWCDTLNNLQRAIDRQGMRELALRVALQMSVADSSSLIDNPLASRLGLYRALFASEDEGRLEKFRPYGLPAEGWLAEVKQQLAGRVNPVGSGA